MLLRILNVTDTTCEILLASVMLFPHVTAVTFVFLTTSCIAGMQAMKETMDSNSLPVDSPYYRAWFDTFTGSLMKKIRRASSLTIKIDTPMAETEICRLHC